MAAVPLIAGRAGITEVPTVTEWFSVDNQRLSTELDPDPDSP